MEAVLFAHVVAVLLMASGTVGGVVATATARRSASVMEVGALVRAHRVAVRGLVVPGSLAALATGLYLTRTAGWSFEDMWIWLSIAAWVVSALVGAGYLGARQRHAIAESTRLIAAGELRISDQLQEAIAGRWVVAGEWSLVAALAIMTALMIFKPL